MKEIDFGGVKSKEELADEGLEAICLKCARPVGVIEEYVEVSDEFGSGGAWCMRCEVCRTGEGPCKKGSHPVRLYFESLGRWGPDGVVGETPEYRELIGKFQKWFTENWTMLRNKLRGSEDLDQCTQ